MSIRGETRGARRAGCWLPELGGGSLGCYPGWTLSSPDGGNGVEGRPRSSRSRVEEARPEREQDAHLKHTAVNRRRAWGCPPGVCARHGSHAPSLGTRHASYGAGPPCSGAAGEETASDKVVAPDLTGARCRPPKVPQLRDADTVAHDTHAPKVRRWVSWGGSLGRRYDKGEI